MCTFKGILVRCPRLPAVKWQNVYQSTHQGQDEQQHLHFRFLSHRLTSAGAWRGPAKTGVPRLLGTHCLWFPSWPRQSRPPAAHKAFVLPARPSGQQREEFWWPLSGHLGTQLAPQKKLHQTCRLHVRSGLGASAPCSSNRRQRQRKLCHRQRWRR